MVAQASRLCCEPSIFSPTGETPVPRLFSTVIDFQPYAHFSQ